MKLLQNSAGNFLNMTPQEAKEIAEKLLKAAEECLTAEPGRGAGFVKTFVLAEERNPNVGRGYGALDVMHIGISQSWLDIHPELKKDLKPRDPRSYGIDPTEINVGYKPHKMK